MLTTWLWGSFIRPAGDQAATISGFAESTGTAREAAQCTASIASRGHEPDSYTSWLCTTLHPTRDVAVSSSKTWQGRKDSNPRPSVLETDALTRLSYAPIRRRRFYPTAHGAPTEPITIDSMAAFVANVGVNSSHAARSPIFDDRTFRLLPIPELVRWRPPMVRFDESPEFAPYAPPTWRRRAMHLDPDLHSSLPTYGDNCRRAGRAFNLRRAAPGDVITFLARLQPATDPPGFYLVGCMYIADMRADVTTDPGPGWWDGNAHIRRARATCRWDSFWVFRGAQGSRYFNRAVAFGKKELEEIFNVAVHWRSTRSELQTIGSYTRAVRRIEGAGEEWLRSICQS